MMDYPPNRGVNNSGFWPVPSVADFAQSGSAWRHRGALLTVSGVRRIDRRRVKHLPDLPVAAPGLSCAPHLGRVAQLAVFLRYSYDSRGPRSPPVYRRIPCAPQVFSCRSGSHSYPKHRCISVQHMMASYPTSCNIGLSFLCSYFSSTPLILPFDPSALVAPLPHSRITLSLFRSARILSALLDPRPTRIACSRSVTD